MLHIFENKEDLSAAAAEMFVQAAQEAVQQHGRFNVALTGGSSPAQLYNLLAQPQFSEQVPWQQTFVFWGDERWVPLSDEKSNAKGAKEALLDKVPVLREHVFPMWQDGATPEAFAAAYARRLQQHFGSDRPQFDLILLGMGEDGHTASLFPGTAVVHEKDALVTAYYLEPQSMYRITLTAPLINAARHIMFLTFGSNKAKALHQVLEGAHNPNLYPSQLIRNDESVHWMVDKAAAVLLQLKNKVHP